MVRKNPQVAALEKKGFRALEPSSAPGAQMVKGTIRLLLLLSLAGAVGSGLLGEMRVMWASIIAVTICSAVVIVIYRPRTHLCQICRRRMAPLKIDVSTAERTWDEQQGARHDYGPDLTYVYSSFDPYLRIYYTAYLCSNCGVYELDEQHRCEPVPDDVDKDRDTARRRHWFLKKSRSGKHRKGRRRLPAQTTRPAGRAGEEGSR